MISISPGVAKSVETTSVSTGFAASENNGTSTSQDTSSKEGDKIKLLLSLGDLRKKKSDLISMMQTIQKSVNEIEEQEKEIKKQIEKMEASENGEQQKQRIIDSIVNLPVQTIGEQKRDALIEKITMVAHSILVINTAKIAKSHDGSGEREHYSVSLVSKGNEEIEIGKWPVDVKKYGEIKQIKVFDGKSETILDADTPSINRLITYLSTDFDAFRKKINTADINGSYSNKYQTFDCQRFSYYLQHGTEGTYQLQFGLRPNGNYKNESQKHVPGRFYSITGETADFGKNGTYSRKDISVHHFMCLTNGVYVSKYGETDILFTSYKHILDAYFPEKFVKGNFCQEYL